MKIAVTETKNVAPLPDDWSALDAAAVETIRHANVEHHVTLMRQAAARDVQAIGFGELFTGPYFASIEHDGFRHFAECTETGPTVTRLTAVARELGMVVVAPVYERHASGRFFNTAVVINAAGARLGQYRKLHIPHGKNEQGSFWEGHYYERGAPELAPLFPVFDTEVGRIGVAICYDRHFEGVMRSLARGGAQLVFAPAVTFGAKSEHYWEREFEVDAMRHNLFIAGSNRLGAEPPFDSHYFGKSYTAGPHGRAEADRSVERLVITDVDFADLTRNPAGWSLQTDQRPDVYLP